MLNTTSTGFQEDSQSATLAPIIGINPLAMADADPEIIAALADAAARPASSPDEELTTVLQILQGRSFSELMGIFNSYRWETPTGEEARSLLADMVDAKNWQLIDDPYRSASLKADIQPLLDLFGKSDAQALIIDDPVPNAAYFAGMAVAYTTGMLAAIEERDELLGITAHEMAHDWFTKLAVIATDEKDYSGLRQIELLCDGVGTLALREIQTDSTGFCRILNRVLGPYACNTHPALPLRLALINNLTFGVRARPGS